MVKKRKAPSNISRSDVFVISFQLESSIINRSIYILGNYKAYNFDSHAQHKLVINKVILQS